MEIKKSASIFFFKKSLYQIHPPWESVVLAAMQCTLWIKTSNPFDNKCNVLLDLTSQSLCLVWQHLRSDCFLRMIHCNQTVMSDLQEQRWRMWVTTEDVYCVQDFLNTQSGADCCTGAEKSVLQFKFKGAKLTLPIFLNIYYVSVGWKIKLWKWV